MQSNISFGSSFHISNSNNDICSVYKIQNYCLDNDINSSMKETYSKKPMRRVEHKVNFRVSVPDRMDYKIEDFCKTHNIEYKKSTFKELMNPLNIMQRIEQPEKDKIKVLVDTKKLEELSEKQDSNLKYCKEEYEEYYKEDIDSMLKSGDKIPASTLWINSNYGDKEDTLEYIQTFGKDRLNEGQISVMFTKETDYPDECTYFGLKDAGMKQVPVYVDKDTFEIGSKLGLFS